MALLIAVASSCSDNSEKSNIHVHEDGSVHQNHDENVKIDQEEFMADSLHHQDSTNHEDGHNHDHEHNHDHSHHDHQH